MNRGLNEEQISEVRNHDYNQDLLKLQEHSTQYLRNSGFSVNQIERIKNFDGQEDAIQYATTYDLSPAYLTGTFYTNPITLNKSIEIWYEFEWNTWPIFMATDCIAIAWKGSGVNSQYVDMSVAYESHNVDYYNIAGEIQYCSGPDVTEDIQDRIIHFPMASDANYAKVIWGFQQIILIT